MRSKRFVVVGATGRVGREMLSILYEIGIPSQNVLAVASERSAGSRVSYGDGDSLEVRDLAKVDFAGYDFVLFSAGSAVSEIYIPKAIESGCVAIDNTSRFRMCEQVPLIVPEINFDDLSRYNSRLIANPNCSTIQMVMALKPLHDMYELREIVVSTYQATSGAGQKGVDELLLQNRQLLANETVAPYFFKKQIAYNVIPQIDEFTDSLYTKEELKMMNETRKILNLPNLLITATCVRVPVLVGHAVSVCAKFSYTVDLRQATEALKNFPGITVMDDPNKYEYATPIDVASKNDVYVSRIRKHPDIPNVLSFWACADNVRKGAALNAVQIAQKLVQEQYKAHFPPKD